MGRPRLRKRPRRPPLAIEQILKWADDWFSQHGRWPNINSGLIPGTIDDTWARIDDGLRNGHRGLPKSSGLSLARLLENRRGVRNSEYPPQLTIGKVVTWARKHRRRTGFWPQDKSGAIEGAPGETWLAIDMALRKGRRGLVEGNSLARLLATHCGVRNAQQAPRLTVRTILKLAEDYFAREGRRPTRTSGAVAGVPGETWHAIDRALASGHRGLSGGSSLARLLNEHRPQWAGNRANRVDKLLRSPTCT